MQVCLCLLKLYDIYIILAFSCDKHLVCSCRAINITNPSCNVGFIKGFIGDDGAGPSKPEIKTK